MAITGVAPTRALVDGHHSGGFAAHRQARSVTANEIRHTLGYDPLSGHVFVFLNRRKNQVKLIVWTRGGFTIVHKRLEQGTFTFPARVTATATSIPIDVHELAMLLEGIDVSRAKEQPRWEPPPRARATTTTTTT